MPTVKLIVALVLADYVVELLDRSDRSASCMGGSAETFVTTEQQLCDIISKRDDSQQA